MGGFRRHVCQAPLLQRNTGEDVISHLILSPELREDRINFIPPARRHILQLCVKTSDAFRFYIVCAMPIATDPKDILPMGIKTFDERPTSV